MRCFDTISPARGSTVTAKADIPQRSHRLWKERRLGASTHRCSIAGRDESFGRIAHILIFVYFIHASHLLISKTKHTIQSSALGKRWGKRPAGYSFCCFHKSIGSAPILLFMYSDIPSFAFLLFFSSKPIDPHVKWKWQMTKNELGFLSLFSLRSIRSIISWGRATQGSGESRQVPSCWTRSLCFYIR